MKRVTRILGLGLAVGICSGCGEPPPDIDPSALRETFADAAPEVQSHLDETVTAVENDNYAEGFEGMTTLLDDEELTSAQLEAVLSYVGEMAKAMDRTPQLRSKEAYAAKQEFIRTAYRSEQRDEAFEKIDEHIEEKGLTP